MAVDSYESDARKTNSSGSTLNEIFMEDAQFFQKKTPFLISAWDFGCSGPWCLAHSFNLRVFKQFFIIGLSMKFWAKWGQKCKFPQTVYTIFE